MRVAWLVSLAIAVSGCALFKPHPVEPLSFRIWVISDLADDYPDVLSLVAAVKNLSNRPLELTLGSRPAHDFLVTDTDGTEIWQWSRRQTVQPMLIPKILNPGEYLIFETKWDQRDNEGQRVPPGEYTVRGLLKLDPSRQLETQPARFSIRPGPPWTIRLEVPLETRLGQKVPLRLRLRNRSDQPLQVRRPIYDFTVTRADAVVWRRSYQKSSEQEILPDEVLEFTEEWDQRDNESNPILPGYYCVRGTLALFGEVERCVVIGSGLPLRLSVEAPAEVQIGQIVPLTLKIENTSGKVLNLEVGYAPHNLIVTTQDGREVWRWTHGKVFPLVALPLTLQPGEVKEYTERWDQQDNEGYPVLQGTYFVRGTFRASQLESLFETELTEPQKLVITP